MARRRGGYARLGLVLLATMITALAVACGGSSYGGGNASARDASPTAGVGARSAGAVRAVEGQGDPRTAWGFDPRRIEVSAGATVSFTNAGNEVHTATADDGSFDTGTLNAGDEKGVTFETAGTFAFHCSLHPWMQGEVVVSGA